MLSFTSGKIISRSCSRSFNIYQRHYNSSWTARLADSSNQFQIYRSSSHDPYINLSIEHHLFQKSPPGSKILFQYVNRPCIVIGRNQNPWLEVNLAILRSSRNLAKVGTFKQLSNIDIDLVRRRSGGGTVFHDEGNVNWSVICDFTEFTRDKHAEMVVRAMRGLGISRSRVNERHDIVLDQISGAHYDDDIDPEDMHKTAYTNDVKRPLKVSGSAYKMARNRALHHGTALLSSPNLDAIPDHLHSPARGHISAKGVASVSSPVTNVGLDNNQFMEAVQQQFAKQYQNISVLDVLTVGEEALDIEEVKKGYEELKSLDWTYLQTPGFTFSSTGANDEIAKAMHPTLSFDARHGAITDVAWTPAGVKQKDVEISDKLKQAMDGIIIHQQEDWTEPLAALSPPQRERMAKILGHMFPVPK